MLWCDTTYGKSVSSSSKKVGNCVGKSVNSVVGKSLSRRRIHGLDMKIILNISNAHFFTQI